MGKYRNIRKSNDEPVFKEPFDFGHADPEQWKKDHPLTTIHVSCDPADPSVSITALKCATTGELLIISTGKDLNVKKRRWSLFPWIKRKAAGLGIRWRF